MIQYYERDDVDLDRLRYFVRDLAIGKRDRNDYSVGMVVGAMSLIIYLLSMSAVAALMDLSLSNAY